MVAVRVVGRLGFRGVDVTARVGGVMLEGCVAL